MAVWRIIYSLLSPNSSKWLGYAFERMCRRRHRNIAKQLGFGAVRYKSGAFFSRKTDKQNAGYQFDLAFERDDKVLTLCEAKYLQGKVKSHVTEEFETKLDLLAPKKKSNHTQGLNHHRRGRRSLDEASLF